MRNRPGPNNRVPGGVTQGGRGPENKFVELLRSCSRNISSACCGVCVTHGQRRGLVSTGFASRNFLTSRLISRQVKSSVYVGEKVSDPTQMVRSAAGNVDQFLVSSSRVRCSLPRQLVNLHWAFDQMQSRPRRGRLRFDPSLGRRRLRRRGSDAPKRRLDKTRCRGRKRRQWQ